MFLNMLSLKDQFKAVAVLCFKNKEGHITRGNFPFNLQLNKHCIVSNVKTISDVHVTPYFVTFNETKMLHTTHH